MMSNKMNQIFVKVILVLFYIVQGFEANPQIKITNRELIKELKEAATEIRDNLETIKGLPQQFDNKIIKSINKMNIPRLVTDFQNVIQDIVDETQSSFVNGIKCIDLQKDDMDELLKNATVGMQQCSSDVKSYKDILIKSEKEVSVVAQDVLSGMNVGLVECYANFSSVSAKITNCLEELLVKAKTIVQSLLAKLREVSQNNQKLIDIASFNVSQCVFKLQTQLVLHEDFILNDLKNCVTVLKE